MSCGDRHTERTQAEIGAIQLQAKECQGLPATGRKRGNSKEGSYPTQGEHRSANALISSFCPPEWCENKYILS